MMLYSNYTDELHEQRAQETDHAAEARKMKVRAQLARSGYRIMHRRNGQFWVMFDNPITLDEIEAWNEPKMAH